MGMKVKISFGKGRWSQAVRSVSEELDAVAEAAAKDIVTEAKTLCPVKTGALRESIEYSKVRTLAYEIVVGMYYAPFVELGTVNMAARPFLTPAVDVVDPMFRAAIENVLRGEAGTAIGGLGEANPESLGSSFGRG